MISFKNRKRAGLSRSARLWRVSGLILALALTLGQGHSSGQVPSNPCPPGSVTPPPGMVAWWSLNEGLGATTVSDSAGGDNDGTPMPGAIGPNGPTPIANIFVGNSLRAGNNRYVRVPPASNLDFGTGNFTIDAWVRFTPGTQTEPIVHKLDANGGYFMYILSNNQGIRNLVLQVGSLKFMGPQITVPIGTWIFVAATRLVPSPTSQVVTLYVGAGDLTAPVQSISSATSAAPLLIGHWPSNPHASLAIDEVEIFNRVLQPTEIAAIRTAGNRGKCWKSGGKGLTWKLNSTNATTGTIDVGCGHSNNVNECNPLTGDTMCTTQLPILCFKPAQLSVPINVNNSDKYHKWSGGIVATTPAVAGNSASNPDLTTIAKADKYCADLFGPGWRVAEFHDGWGWYFQAYGGLGQPSKRFWVDINDQRSTASTPKATCWH